ncbi:MAG: class I SAM-dependent methyltransferase [Halioglobus sp.]|nr:class I SAM-dependent methyltransferase [Halioglobus sp.]
MLKSLIKSKSHWDNLASPESKKDFNNKSWGGVAQVAQNHNYLITGDQNYYWIDYLKDRYFDQGNAGHTLSIGCGEGYIERLFKERGFSFDSVTGIDLSKKCTEAAQKRAEEIQLAPHIEYITADLNNFVLPERKFDFIFFFHSLHHVEALEKLLENCAQALAPDGILMVNEFVGPTRFQWTKEQLREANKLFKFLPAELRLDLNANKEKMEIKTFTVEEMISIDESEAVRSAEIEVVLKAFFNIVEEKNWGGTLTNLIFDNTAGNFDSKNEYHNSIANLLVHHENILIEKGLFPSDFKFFIGKPK